MADLQLKRLHISPLDPALLEVILAPSVRPLATDVSFHTLQTFPENNFGFINLPRAEAEKLMKKLNGSILKGKKFKIQEARERPLLNAEAAAQREAIDSNIHTKKNSPVGLKRKSVDVDTIPGYELPSNRKVVRGWTEVPSKDRRLDKAKNQKSGRQRSKFSAGKECLFRTAPLAKERVGEQAEEKLKHRDKKDKNWTVHEFKNSTKYPSFIRAQGDVPDAKLSSEYVEGKGWVDREGNLKEPFVPKSKPKSPVQVPTIIRKSTKKTSSKEETDSEVADSSSESSDNESELLSDSSISDSSDDAGHESSSDEVEETGHSLIADNEDPAKGRPVKTTDDTSTSSGITSSGSDNDTSAESSDDTVEPEDVTPPPSLTNVKADKPLDAETEVHPLEALFKRTVDPTPRPQLEIKTQFSFFGNTEEDDDIDNDDDSNFHNNNDEPPHTPFTKRDLQARNLRSAAPTPDTAAITKTRFWEDELDEDIVEEEAEENYGEEYAKSARASEAQTAPKADQQESEESQFAKWFWENRGDNNRAWKRRRREAAKEKRQKENRQRGRKGRF